MSKARASGPNTRFRSAGRRQQPAGPYCPPGHQCADKLRRTRTDRESPRSFPGAARFIRRRIRRSALDSFARPSSHRVRCDMSTSSVPQREPAGRRDRKRSLPTGNVTFLFTDIEGSTALLTELGADFLQVRDRHDQVIRAAIQQGGGIEIATEGDSFFAAFPTAVGALRAAVAAQRALFAAPETTGRRVEARMGIHTGEGQLGGASYVGIDVHRAARIASAGHGGQVLLSDATRGLVESQLPDGVTVRDLGSHRLKDLRRPEHLYDLLIAGIRTDFPALRSMRARPTNLPLQLTSFIGRHDEVSAVVAQLEVSRLVTLTGTGGAGKTRLAVEAAGSIVDRFPDGVWF